MGERMTYKCICCSTTKEPVYTKGIKKDGFVECEFCGSIELEEVEKDDTRTGETNGKQERN